MFQEIFIIENNNELLDFLKELFKEEKFYRIKSFKTDQIDIALSNIPNLIIINEDDIDLGLETLCAKIRQNEDNSITPVIVISSNDDQKHVIDILKMSIEYYIHRTNSDEYIYYSIKNIIRLLNVNRTVSPLTALPGNLQIQTELKKRLLKKEGFIVLYFDLDNFKSYNDVYGFLKGDEIIKLTAKLITKNIHGLEKNNSFVGHIGGDDFVGIIDVENDYESLCQNIIVEFDFEVLKHFNEEDVKRGYLEVKNRKNITEQFNLTSLSIGVIIADNQRFKNILEIGEAASQVKQFAKSTLGSSYAIDRRKHTN